MRSGMAVIVPWACMRAFRMCAETDVVMVWAWMLSYSHSLEHEHYCGLGMDALLVLIARIRTY